MVRRRSWLSLWWLWQAQQDLIKLTVHRVQALRMFRECCLYLAKALLHKRMCLVEAFIYMLSELLDILPGSFQLLSSVAGQFDESTLDNTRPVLQRLNARFWSWLIHTGSPFLLRLLWSCTGFPPRSSTMIPSTSARLYRFVRRSSFCGVILPCLTSWFMY